MTLMLFNRDEGNHEFSTALVVQYIHLSLLIKTFKPDQGVSHSIGHVRFIVMEIGGYLHYIDTVSKSKTCVVLKSQMERPDNCVHMQFQERLSQGLHASVESNYIDRVHTYTRGECTKEVTRCSETTMEDIGNQQHMGGKTRKWFPLPETRPIKLTIVYYSVNGLKDIYIYYI